MFGGCYERSARHLGFSGDSGYFWLLYKRFHISFPSSVAEVPGGFSDISSVILNDVIWPPKSN